MDIVKLATMISILFALLILDTLLFGYYAWWTYTEISELKKKLKEGW